MLLITELFDGEASSIVTEQIKQMLTHNLPVYYTPRPNWLIETGK